MYRYNKKTTSFMFGFCLLLGILLFGVFGATFAYFQIENYVKKDYILGSVGVHWLNNNTEIFDSSEIELNTVAALVRGDDKGVNILSIDGKSAGMIKIAPNSNTQMQYVRIRYRAFIDGVEVSEITEDLVLRIYEEGAYIALGSEDSVWIDGTDGWYYYPTAIESGTTPISVANNIQLIEIDQIYLEKELKIKFEFETLQAANDPVESVWGEAAKNALGIYW